MDRPDRLEEAGEVPAEALMLDLTDLVAETRKDEARARLAEFLDSGPATAAWVRVARTEQTERVAADLDAAVRPGVTGIIVPECESPAEVEQFDRWLTELESQRDLDLGSTRLLPMPETALAIHNYYETLTASPRVAGAWFPGAPGGDLCRDVGYRWSHEGMERIFMRGKVVVDARAAGIENILDSGSLYVQDFEVFERECIFSSGLGFTGRLTHNRTQVELANRLYGPTAEQVASAEREIAAWRDAEAAGIGTIELDGRIIDVTSVKYADRVLARAGRLSV